jgi:hypothetical protein
VSNIPPLPTHLQSHWDEVVPKVAGGDVVMYASTNDMRDGDAVTKLWARAQDTTGTSLHALGAE